MGVTHLPVDLRVCIDDGGVILITVLVINACYFYLRLLYCTENNSTNIICFLVSDPTKSRHMTQRPCLDPTTGTVQAPKNRCLIIFLPVPILYLQYSSMAVLSSQ
jgi:hypothetical protein